MSTERFVISQLEAHFAKDHDLVGKQDPYVVFELGSEKITTPAIKSGGVSCNWEESFTLIGRNEASDLQATVYNKNTLRPDGMLGMATHRILHKTEPGKLKMELTDKKGNNTGEILFILQASGGRFAQSGNTSSNSRGTGSGVGSGTGTGAGLAGAGAGAAGLAGASGRSTGSEERRNENYEGTTSSGARSGATGATGAGYGSGSGTGTGAGYGSGTGTGAGYSSTTTTSGAGYGSGTGTGAGYSSGTTGGVTEGVRGLNLTSESGYASGTGGSTVTQTNNPICDTKYYTKIEDRPVVKQITTFVREHHPVEKEFVVETRPTGQEREQVQGRTQEVVDTKERVVEVTQPNPCGGVPTSQVVGSGSGVTGSGVGSGSGVTGSGVTGTGSGRTGY